MLLDYAPRQSVRIGLTPLIDVVFIMLLFFMLSSSFSRWFALDVSMHEQEMSHKTRPLRLVLVNDAGALFLDGQRFPGLTPQLQNLLIAKTQGKSSSTMFLLDVVAQVKTQKIVDVLEALKRSGVEQVSLGTTVTSASILEVH